MLIKLSSEGFNPDNFFVDITLMFFSKPGVFPFSFNIRLNTCINSGLSGFISANLFRFPSNIWSNIFPFSCGGNSISSSRTRTSPACDSLTLISVNPRFFRTSSASVTSSTSATTEFSPISSAPHCHFSLDFFPVSSNINTLVT